MNKVIGVAPKHPGLWCNSHAVNEPQTQNRTISTISIMKTKSHGAKELLSLSNQLANLSQQGRWIVLISPPNIDYKQLLMNSGVRMDRVLLVHTKDEVETLWAMEKALTSGTSSAVICWTQVLDARDSRRLELVANSAQAMGVVIEDPMLNDGYGSNKFNTKEESKILAFSLH